MKIFYLHGLGSSGQSSTVQKLRELGYDVIAPDYRPEYMAESLSMIQKAITEYQADLIIGTSMGGYYALKLAEQIQQPIIAINPCFDPKAFLEKYLTEPAVNWQTGESIEITAEMLERFSMPNPTSSPIVVTGMRDDLIEPKKQLEFCQANGFENIQTDWGHRVGDVSQLQSIIESVENRCA